MHRFLEKNKLFILIILSLIPLLITIVRTCYSIHWSDFWPTFNYFIGYEYGFGGRKLIGTLFNFFFPGYVTCKTIRWIVLPTHFLLVILLCYLLWVTFKNKNEKISPIISLLIIYSVSPFSIWQYINHNLSFAFTETYQIVLILIWLILFINHRNTWYYYVITPLVMISGCLIHHTFCCTLFPLMAGLMLFDAFSGESISYEKISVYGFFTFVLLGLFICLWFFSEMNIDIDTLYAKIQTRTNTDVIDGIDTDKEGLRLLYFMTNAENRDAAMSSSRILRFFVELIFLLPLLCFLISPWIISSINAKTFHERLRYLLPIFAEIGLTLPVFFMATDYSRWWVCFFFTLISISLAVFSSGDKNFLDALGKLSICCKKYKWIIPLIILYSLQLHNSKSFFANGLDESEHIISMIQNLF